MQSNRDKVRRERLIKRPKMFRAYVVNLTSNINYSKKECQKTLLDY